ncbi:MAG: lamin tail domain-containing protein [Bacteroidaceae bacterium]|nr:lamin tail domain-containing protein [Bacteroidaceae bacterium]
MKKTAILTALLLAVATTAGAQTWIDITEDFVQNPNFDGSIDGWTDDFDNAANNHGYQSSSYRNGDVRIQHFAEAWIQSSWWGWGGTLGDAAIYQQLKSVPKGKLRLEVDGIAVNQSNAQNTTTGVLLFIAEEGNEAVTAMSTDNEKPQHFTVEITSQKPDITIGVRTESTSANWLAFDNVRLYWYGQEVKLTSITFDETSLKVTQGEQVALQVTTAPENATYKGVNFSSSNENAATVDANGVVTARHPGITTITATADHYPDVTARCIITVEANEVGPQSVIFNEIQQSNLDMFLDPSFNFGGWVELYNATDRSASLDGLYLSDDASDLKKMPLLSSRHGVVPAKGFLTLWFDHYSRWSPKMITFKLDSDGGNLYISNESGTILSEFAYPPAITRTSYARTTDGGNTWNYTDQPTPSATNTTSSFAATRLAPPVIDADGGFFTTPFTAKATIPAGATLRYTTDGSTPTLDNGETSRDGSFSISETTILRLRLYQEGQLASSVLTRSYIYKDRNYTLPVISLVSDNANLYGSDYGIFVQGNGNGRPGNGQSGKCNWNMDWDREANIEYFDEQGHAVFTQEVGIEASGGWSRAWTPHSFNIKANKVYEGLNRMDFQFFEDKPFLRHKALKVRNGGNDNNDRIKDPAIQEVVRTSGLYVETQCYKPVHIFHNGKYIGVENLREPNNKNYGYANYGIDTDAMDQWKMSPDSGYVQQEGTRDIWEEWYTLTQNASDALTYERIKQIVDIEEYINYMAVEFYIAGTDWPKNNIKSFRERSEGSSNSRFRFVLFDTDHAFATNNPFDWFKGTQYWTFDQLYGVSDLYPSGRIYDEIEFTTIFLNMLQNEEFKKQFVDQFCIVAGSVFESTRAAEVINAMVAHVNPAMSLEGRSATSSANSVRNNFSSSRPGTLISAMRNFLGLGSYLSPQISANIDEAIILINGLQVPTGKFSGPLFPPATIQVSAPAGYKFVGWRNAEGGKQTDLFAKGTSWTYYDQGSLDGQEWTSSSYSTSTWKTGKAPLGYFTSDGNNGRGYQTFLDYGGNDNSKYPTYYFRKQFNLSSTPKTTDTFTLDWVADDGFVIYVNGNEAGRFLMDNSPTPTFNSYADTYANANPESGTMTLRSTYFKKGTNVIAVEVHNNSGNSTDIYWDASLTQSTQVTGDFIATDETFILPSSGKYNLVATYEPLSVSELPISDSHPVKINEVSAANDIYVSELFKKSDWIELYNTTDSDIDIEGMYLSDHLEEPEKWQISAGTEDISTIIPAHGHMVIWADKNAGVNQLHADFKLNNEDSCLVLLTAADKSWADTLVYCRHDGYHTVGLFPDGGSDLYVMERPTIGQTNVLTTAAVVWNEPKIHIIEDRVPSVADDHSLALTFDGQAITLHAPAAARLDIYTPSGQLVHTARIQPSIPHTLSMLQHGIYIARSSLGEEQTTLKFTIH